MSTDSRPWIPVSRFTSPSTPFRSRGSPPVIRTLVIPIATNTLVTRSISSKDSRYSEETRHFQNSNRVGEDQAQKKYSGADTKRAHGEGRSHVSGRDRWNDGRETDPRTPAPLSSTEDREYYS